MPTDVTLLRADLYQHVLLSPVGEGADELHVLSGYASGRFALFHVMDVREHLKKDVSVRLYVGMTGEEGVELGAHREMVGAIRSLSGSWLQCRYAPRGQSDHTKLYVWLRHGEPMAAWMGSANYSYAGFGIGSSRRETMTAVDPVHAWSVLQKASSGWISATADDLLEHVHMYELLSAEVRGEVLDLDQRTAEAPDGVDSVTLPLVQVTRNPGEVHNGGAGLNWGQRPRRRGAEAYIPIPSAVSKSGFFPVRGTPFPMHMDDGRVIHFVVAQDGDKALHSVPDNSEIGVWFRRRLGIADDAFVTTADLERYGAKQVTVVARDDGSYRMRFTPRG